MTTKVILSGLLIFCFALPSNAQFQKESGFFSVPFHQSAKLILVEATVDKQKGFFILDTGSPELILNSAHFNYRRSGSEFKDIGGYAVNTQAYFVSFSLGDIRIRSKRSLIIDLSHLERKRNIKILGMIGYSVLNKHELLIDYEAKELGFFKLDKKGNRLGFSSSYSSSVHKMAFNMKGHLPCMEISIGEHAFCVALDSGAGVNLLNPQLQKQLAPFCSDVRPTNVTSFSRQGFSSNAALLKGVSLAGVEYPPMRTLFKSIHTLNKDLGVRKIDGLFGFEFLRHNTISINYKKKELTFWKTYQKDILIVDNQRVKEKKEPYVENQFKVSTSGRGLVNWIGLGPEIFKINDDELYKFSEALFEPHLSLKTRFSP